MSQSLRKARIAVGALVVLLLVYQLALVAQYWSDDNAELTMGTDTRRSEIWHGRAGRVPHFEEKKLSLALENTVGSSQSPWEGKGLPQDLLDAGMQDSYETTAFTHYRTGSATTDAGLPIDTESTVGEVAREVAGEAAGEAAGGVLAPPVWHARRLLDEPLIAPANIADAFPHSSMGGGTSINGASVVAIPPGIAMADQLPSDARYLLYFSHHAGKFIAVASARDAEGPWSVCSSCQVMPISDASLWGSSTALTHVASPDVHISEEKRCFVMYIHVQTGACPQFSLAATSVDGVSFQLMEGIPLESRCPTAYIPFYFRRFSYQGQHYGLVKADPSKGHASGALLLRHSTEGGREEGLYDSSGNALYEEGPTVLDRSRHTSVLIIGPYAVVALSRIGDFPEHIEVECHRLEGHNWMEWFSESTLEYRMDLLVPSTVAEGALEPLRPSRSGAAGGLANELRDPFLFLEPGERHHHHVLLFFSIGGEHGISVAHLDEMSPSDASLALSHCRNSCSLSEQRGFTGLPS